VRFSTGTNILCRSTAFRIFFRWLPLYPYSPGFSFSLLCSFAALRSFKPSEVSSRAVVFGIKKCGDRLMPKRRMRGPIYKMSMEEVTSRAASPLSRTADSHDSRRFPTLPTGCATRLLKR
jgi:hypothetical protein